MDYASGMSTTNTTKLEAQMDALEYSIDIEVRNAMGARDDRFARYCLSRAKGLETRLSKLRKLNPTWKPKLPL